MPSPDSPAIIIARFLKSNDYERTLDAFLEEARLPPDAGTSTENSLTIEKILDEKRIFDLTTQYEKYGIEETPGWSSPSPTSPTSIQLPDQANILHISAGRVRKAQHLFPDTIFVTTAARRLYLLDAEDGTCLIESLTPQDSPILSWTYLGESLSIGTGMSGQVILYDHCSQTIVSERRDHKKYVVKATAFHDDEGTHWVATAGWDAKVFLYRMSMPFPSRSTSDSESIGLSSPVSELSLLTNPEDVVFYRPVKSSRLILIVSRRDSTSLYYYNVTFPRTNATGSSLEMIGSQNLAPHSAAWSTFSPSALALNPIDPGIVAVATSSIPFLKVIIARLLVPDEKQDSPSLEDASTNLHHIPPISLETQARAGVPSHHPLSNSSTPVAWSHAGLTIEETLNAAVLVHASTQGPQSHYSTPRIVWRPDGSGVWVNADDGAIRGVEARSGRVIATLKGGHEAGVKVRDLWTGWVKKSGSTRREEREEWLISGGFDRRLVLWKINQGGGR